MVSWFMNYRLSSALKKNKKLIQKREKYATAFALFTWDALEYAGVGNIKKAFEILDILEEITLKIVKMSRNIKMLQQKIENLRSAMNGGRPAEVNIFMTMGGMCVPKLHPTTV